MRRSPEESRHKLLESAPGESPTRRVIPPTPHVPMREVLLPGSSSDTQHPGSSLGLVTWALSPASTRFQTPKGTQAFGKSHVMCTNRHREPSSVSGGNSTDIPVSGRQPTAHLAFLRTAAPGLLCHLLCVYIKLILFPNFGTFHPPNTSPLRGRFIIPT